MAIVIVAALVDSIKGRVKVRVWRSGFGSVLALPLVSVSGQYKSKSFRFCWRNSEGERKYWY